MDIAPSVMSNVLSSDLTILNQTPSLSDVHIIHLTPTTTDCNSSLVVHRNGEHYNGIVKVPSLYSGQKNESLVVSPVSSEYRLTTYSREFLHQCNRKHAKPHRLCHKRLIRFGLLNAQRTPVTRNIQSCKVGCLNVQSVKNKTLSIIEDCIKAENFDLLAITETWLGGALDQKCINP